jgi:thiamine biosynthesis lipoprotein
MKSSSLLILPVIFGALSVTGSSTVAIGDRLYQFNYENVLGTSLELKIGASSEAQAEKAQSVALSEIDREAKILSSWDPASEVSRWELTHDEPVHVSPELFEVLGLYDHWRERTDGALDATAEAVVRVWKNAAAEQRNPAPAELKAAVEKVQLRHWRLDPATRTATHLSDTPLVLASFTKGYILRRAADAAMAMGISSVVVNIGGDLAVRGVHTELVNIADPRADAENDPPMAKLTIHDRAVATSGDYRRGFEIAGKHYSHIVDPRTGLPADDVISSTVIASNPVDAGALATAFSVMTPAQSEQLARSIPGVEYLLVKKDGQRVESPGWHSYAVAGILRPPLQGIAALLPAAAATGDQWDPSMLLTIHVELARPFGFAKRPYLAAWIEDPNHVAVRTLALWYGKQRFLSDLRAWSRAQRNASSQVASSASSVSSATRGPGKYTIDWDGKDAAGKYVKEGKYTVYVEVAREHGTYALLHQELDFSGTPRQVTFQPNTEVAAALFDYHRR